MSRPPVRLPASAAPSDPPAFLGCSEIEAVVVPIAGQPTVCAVRALFLGSAESETWNSWLRAPRLPPPGSLSLVGDGLELPSEERRFVAALHPQAPVGGATLIELRFAERALSELILRLPAGRWALCRVSAERSDFAGLAWPGGAIDGPDLMPQIDLPNLPPQIDLPDLPPQIDLPKHGDVLAEEVRARAALREPAAADPTLDDIYSIALPYRGGALLGVFEGPIAYQLWDGGIILRPDEKSRSTLGDRLLLSLRLDQQPLWTTAPRQALGEGFLPIGQVALDRDGVHVKERAWIDAAGTLRIELGIDNASAQPAQLALHAVTAQRLTAQNDAKLHAELQTPLNCRIEDGLLRLSAATDNDVTTASLQAPPGQSVSLSLRLPLDAPRVNAPIADAAFLAAGAQLDLPDPFLMNLWRALLVHNRLFIRDGVMRYGLFPGLYENGLFGIEEGWNIVSLAQLGHAELAATTLERTFFDAEFLKKEGPHHQYRNGLAITYALDVASLANDTQALARLWPTVKESADWIAAAFASTRTLRGDTRPPEYGLMPKHIYGGDLRTPAYSLYASSACWRGLRDAARVAARLGETGAAAQFAQAAQTVRGDILAAAERIYVADGEPPYLPFSTDETAKTPSSGDYYQLFASLILETALFGWRGRFAYALTDYLFATGRQVLGVPRFDGWFGRLGIDAEYARGSQLAALQRRDFDRFYLGMLGQIGLSCDRDTFVSPETAVVRFSAREQAERLRAIATQATRCDSDPCSAGTGVMLQYLRHLLVTEARDEDDLPTGTLWLAAAAPTSFFQPNTRFGVDRLPTVYGTISFRCTTETRWVIYDITHEGAGPDEAPLEVEPFYRDSDGKRRSIRARVQGHKRLTIPRL